MNITRLFMTTLSLLSALALPMVSLTLTSCGGGGGGGGAPLGASLTARQAVEQGIVPESAARMDGTNWTSTQIISGQAWIIDFNGGTATVSIGGTTYTGAYTYVRNNENQGVVTIPVLSSSAGSYHAVTIGISVYSPSFSSGYVTWSEQYNASGTLIPQTEAERQHTFDLNLN